MSLEVMRRQILRELEKLRAPEGYLRAGWPRYDTLFGRDSLIAAWQTLALDPSIARAALQVLARYQGRRVDAAAEEEPGKILHEHRFDLRSQADLPGWKFPYYGSVDSTLLLLIVADLYVRTTDDDAFLQSLWPSVLAAYRWMREHGDRDNDGYIEYARRNPSGLFHQGWKDGSEDHLRIEPPVALVEVQGYAHAALLAFAGLADRMGDEAASEAARRSADSLRRRLNEDFWWPDEGTFVLALDGRKRRRAAVTSNPGHLLMTKVVDDTKGRRLADRLFRDDLWTPFGIRTHASSEPDFDPYGYHMGTIWPHDNWFIYKGLLACGHASKARKIREALIRAFEALGRIPELYAVCEDRIVDLSDAPVRGTQANPIQAWSLGALLDVTGPEGSPTP